MEAQYEIITEAGVADGLLNYNYGSRNRKEFIYEEGNQWCVLEGGNLLEGVAGFGVTPEKAVAAFVQAMKEELDVDVVIKSIIVPSADKVGRELIRATLALRGFGDKFQKLSKSFADLDSKFEGLEERNVKVGKLIESLEEENARYKKALEKYADGGGQVAADALSGGA